MYHRLSAAAVVVTTFALSILAFAEAFEKPELLALRGLRGVSLLVAETDPALHDRGITAEVIESGVALTLRQAGIPILNHGDPGEPSGNPTLFIEVLALLNEDADTCTYSVQLELTQNVQLDRDDAVRLEFVPTWRTGGLAHADQQWRAAILDEVQLYAEQFVDAYLAANPH